MYQLYHHYNSKNELLYVGISLNALNRLISHKHTSSWFGEIALIKIKHYPSKREVMAAEKKEVQTKKPKYNLSYIKPKKISPCGKGFIFEKCGGVSALALTLSAIYGVKFDRRRVSMWQKRGIPARILLDNPRMFKGYSE